MDVRCSNCGQMNRFPRLTGGKKARCAKCKTVLAKSDPELPGKRIAFRKLQQTHRTWVFASFGVAAFFVVIGIACFVAGTYARPFFYLAAVLGVFGGIYGWLWIAPPEKFNVDTIPTPLGGVIVTWSGEMHSSTLVPKFRAILETDPFADLVKYGERLNIDVHEVERPFAAKDPVAEHFSKLLTRAKSLLDAEKLREQFLKEHPELKKNPELLQEINDIFYAYSRAFKL